jgi:hypothetical protein
MLGGRVVLLRIRTAKNFKKFEVSLGRFRADIGDENWNLKGFGFDEA